MVLWKPTRASRTNTQKRCLFIIGNWNEKVGSQEIPGVTGKLSLGVQNERGQRLIEFCQENALVTENTLFQQHNRRLYTWKSADGQYWNQIDYILCSKRWRSSIQSTKTRPGADCVSDHELLIAKFRLKLKKVGKTTRPFSYDLNQIPYDYTVEMRNRFKGLDLIDRVPDELWTEVRDIVQETGSKIIPKRKKCKQAKCLSFYFISCFFWVSCFSDVIPYGMTSIFPLLLFIFLGVVLIPVSCTMLCTSIHSSSDTLSDLVP